MSKSKNPFIWTGPFTVFDFKNLVVDMIKTLARDQGVQVKRIEISQTVPISIKLEECKDGPPWYKFEIDFASDPGSVYQNEELFKLKDEPPEQ